MKKLPYICALLTVLFLFNGCIRLPVIRIPEAEKPLPAATTAPETATAATTEPAPTTAPTVAPTEPTEPTEPEIPAVAAGFGDVYTDICHLLDTGDLELAYTYVTVGMKEIIGSIDTVEARYQSITYGLEDMDGDGIREMVVLDAMGNSRIVAIFTLQYGVPVMTHEGWARSRLYRLSDGSLYHEGSSGAAYSIFEAHGQCWFTYPKDDAQMEVGFYHAADGIYDPATAREITAEEYEAKQVALSRQITAFSAYPFH